MLVFGNFRNSVLLWPAVFLSYVFGRWLPVPLIYWSSMSYYSMDISHLATRYEVKYCLKMIKVGRNISELWQTVLKNIILTFLVNDQLDAQFFSVCLFQFSTCFEQPRAHHQENQLYQYNIWYMSLCVGDRFVETVTDTEWHIPDVVLMQLILLMMSTRLLETCTELK